MACVALAEGYMNNICPTEAQVRAMLETARSSEMSAVEREIGDDAFHFVVDAVRSGVVTWSEVMYDPHYVVAQVFDNYFLNLGWTQADDGSWGEPE